VDLIPKNLAQERYIDALEDPNINIVFACGYAGSGKAQPLTSQIKVPGGWISMGDVQLGTIVTTPDGKTANVIGVFPQGAKDVYEITFSDGRKTEACGEHLWETFYNGRVKKIMSTAEMIEFQKTHSRPLRIRLAEHEEMDDVELPIDPYLLGAIIGDGSFSQHGNITFSTSDQEVLENIQLACVADGEFYKIPKSSYDYKYRSHRRTNIHQRANRKGIFGTRLAQYLHDSSMFGLKSDSKYIPEPYLHSSKSQKINLLKGLIDTDGYASGGNSIIYTTVSRRLADNIAYLVRSIGGTAKITEHVSTFCYNGEKRKGKVTYNITINYRNKQELVSISRKKERLSNADQYASTGKISISSIRLIGKKPCQCIMIDSPEHLYVTDDFIVTHNTYLATLYAIQCLKEGTCDKIVITRPNVAVDDRDIGALPGDILKKMAPWTRPVLDVLEEYFSVKEITAMIEENIIELCPLAYIRGRTFKNSIILLDEAQNTTKSSMLSALTRIGEGSKMVVTGDTRQSDRGHDNGLTDFLGRFEKSKHIAVCHFDKKSVERHPIIGEILHLYGEE
jgi:phosphate starvation-inducible protein PhoH